MLLSKVWFVLLAATGIPIIFGDGNLRGSVALSDPPNELQSLESLESPERALAAITPSTPAPPEGEEKEKSAVLSELTFLNSDPDEVVWEWEAEEGFASETENLLENDFNEFSPMDVYETMEDPEDAEYNEAMPEDYFEETTEDRRLTANGIAGRAGRAAMASNGVVSGLNVGNGAAGTVTGQGGIRHLPPSVPWWCYNNKGSNQGWYWNGGQRTSYEYRTCCVRYVRGPNWCYNSGWNTGGGAGNYWYGGWNFGGRRGWNLNGWQGKGWNSHGCQGKGCDNKNDKGWNSHGCQGKGCDSKMAVTTTQGIGFKSGFGPASPSGTANSALSLNTDDSVKGSSLAQSAIDRASFDD